MLLLSLLLTIFTPTAEELPYSWKDNNPVPITDLRVVVVPYFGFDDTEHVGKVVVHAKVAEEILEIFEEVYTANYPIEKIYFVDEYGGNDELSASDNNSYSFCSREITGAPGVFSKHSYGLAIDINPLYNPFYKNTLIVPKNGAAYLDRTLQVKGTIVEGDALHHAFTSRGWEWGGTWPETRGYGDYHHFEKSLSILVPNCKS